MDRPIIFLDVDGVLNRISTHDRTPGGFIGVDDRNLMVLKKMVEETCAEIVLSSSWKMCWIDDIPDADGQYLVDRLREYGIEIIGRTPDYPKGGYYRGHEILQWLQENGIRKFVVLDDDIFPDFREMKITRNMVQTSKIYGIEEKHIRVAKKIIENNGKIEYRRENDQTKIEEFDHFGREIDRD